MLERRKLRDRREGIVHRPGDEVFHGNGRIIGVAIHDSTHCGVERWTGEQRDLARNELFRGCLAEGTGLSLECYNGAHPATSPGRPTRTSDELARFARGRCVQLTLGQCPL